MTRYRVRVIRTLTQEAYLEVEAPDDITAMDLADDQAKDAGDWRTIDYDWEPDSVEEVA